MVRWLPTLGKALGGFETKDAPTRRASQGRGYVYRDQAYVPPGSNVDRMVRDGYERVIWAFKAIDATADKMSSWPIECMEGLSPKDWKSVDDPCLPLLNGYANQIERSAKYFRYRVVSQLLLSKRGVFVEVIPTNGGGLAALNLLPPGLTAPIPDPDKFLAGFRVELPGDDKPYVDLPVYDPDKRAGVIWIRKPHPTDPYSSITPLEAAGISLDLDFYARLYNRNFLVNDGRAGQIVAVKGGLSVEDAAELKARFSPGMGGAGRTSVIEAEAISVEDTAVSPRDAQYAQLRNITKEDLLIALGTPESVIGNASGRTFDNADAEKENWLDVTVLPLSQVVESGFDALTEGGWGDDRRIIHDTSSEPVLQRAKQRRIDRAAQDVTQGLRTRDEFREIAELEPFDTAVSRTAWAPITGMTPVGKPDDVTEALKLVGEVATANQPTPPGGSADPAAGDPGGLEGFDPGIMSDPALPQALSEVAGAPPADLTAAAADLELEWKKFNPAQPRYPAGHPQGGKFMDEGDVALWLAGKPLKGGFPSSSVVNPNTGSTAAPATVTGGAGGASRFSLSPDPKVRAAAAVLTFPPRYPYPRVLGAPPASIVNASPKPTKVVSLRKGDVVRLGPSGGFAGGDWAVADAKRKGGGIDLTLVNDQGQVRHVPAASGQQTLDAVARTPHPTTVADAKRTISAAHHGAGGTPAGQAPSVTPTPAPAPAPAAPVAPNSPAAAPLPSATPGVYAKAGSSLTVTVSPSGTITQHSPSGVQRRISPAAFNKSGVVGTSGYQLQTPAQVSANLPLSVAAQNAGLIPRQNVVPTPPASTQLPIAQQRAQTVAQMGGTPGTTLAGRIRPGQQWVASDGTVVTHTGTGLAVHGGSTGFTAAAPDRVSLSYLQIGRGSQKRWAVVAGTQPVPPVAAPAAPPPAPAGAALPASIAAALGPNTQVFRHPQQGKLILVQPGGQVQAFKADGTKASTSATAGKLAAGHGAWQQISHAQLLAGTGAPTPAGARKAAATARARPVTPPPPPAPVAAPTPAVAPAPTPAPAAPAPVGAPSILTYPPNYPYPRVAGAPPATAVPAPKPIKVASLRKGDVIRHPMTGRDVAIVSVSAGSITVQGQGGTTSTLVSAAYPQGTLTAVARTPHPTKVAAARRAQSGAAGPAGPAPRAAAATPPPPAAPPAAAPAPRAATAAAPAPTFTPPPAPVPGPPGAPTFTPQVGSPAAGFLTQLQPGQVFIHPRTGNRMTIGTSGGGGTLTLGSRARGGTSGPKSPAMTARTLKTNGWQADSGPDIDTPGDAHNAAVRKAQRTANLPPVGVPYRAPAPTGAVYPAAATGPATPTARSNLTRGMTVRVAGEDWIVTDTGSTGVWGYRPGVDDPNVIVRQPDDTWRQGALISGIPTRAHSTVDVIGSPPIPARNVPSTGTARPYDPALPAATTANRVGTMHGPGFDVTTQTVPANQLRAGDSILINGRESEGLFVVTAVGVDGSGRQNVQGYPATTADATGVPGVPGHLFLTSPGSGPMRETRVQVDGAVPAPPSVPRPVAPKPPSDVSRADISTPATRAQLMSVLSSPPPRLGTAPGSTSIGDTIMGHLQALRGYNEQPDVVSEADMDDYVKGGEIELWRGMQQKPGVDVAEEYRSGKHYPGGTNGTAYGTGTYAAYGTHPNSGRDAIQFAQGHGYGGGSNGVLVRMTIKADARIIEHDELQKKLIADTSPEATALKRKLSYGALGHYAVMLGYDVIRKSHGYQQSHHRNDSNNWDDGFVVIVNRSAIRISEKNYVPDHRVGSAPAGASPPPLKMSQAKHRMRNRSAKHENDVDYRVKAEP